MGLDEYVDDITLSIKQPQQQISKFLVSDKDIKLETTPNAVVIGTSREEGVNRIRAAEIPTILLAHPALERGIEFKFNRIIAQLDKNNIGTNVILNNDSGQAKKARDYILDILSNSAIQPIMWVKQFGQDSMRFGDNYSLLIPNKNQTKIIKWELQHPVFFGPMFDFDETKPSLNSFATREDPFIKYRINPKTKKPESYTQLQKIDTTFMGMSGNQIQNPLTMKFRPVGKVYPASMVTQLNFDRMGDEPLGIPLAQTLWHTIRQILRVENAGAETMVAFGNNRWLAHTPFRTKEKMQEFAKSIENIAKRSVVVLPDGVTLENIKPGSTEFDKVHNILLSLISMRLGISRIQLIGEGADINKSTLTSMIKDITYDFFADELVIEAAINDSIIKSCNYAYNLRSTEDFKKFPYPKFRFGEMDEDKDILALRHLKQTLATWNVVKSIDMLKTAGFESEAKSILLNHINVMEKIR